ncbi:putative ABC exporter domain-containing protein [Clostridium aestuarii]|uniref:ABC exporter domain-containing protein n=1 Tax=Clostridium aestuarii TaxID=338193 RepID=A0ABT4CWK7_9CLOT|nr:putative ABC exporter domain-containing protein [Clostridium aestuarii]MCY6483379.1 putative ABC exporter domain-containing protein [Clostridium aestuarii]
MKPLFYLMKKTFKNYLKDLKRKPFALIGYIVIAALMIGAIVMSAINPSQRHTHFSNYRFGFIVGMVLMIFFYLSIKDGLAKGSSFFRLSDVNLVFTAPISPKKVLIYGILKQLYRTFIMLFFIVLQIPNMSNWFNLKSYASIILILGVFVFMFSMSIIGILVYSIASRSEKYREMFEKVLKVVAIIFIGIALIQVMKTKNIALAGETIFNSRYFSYIPILGWTKEILMACVYGISNSFYIYGVITVIFIAIMIYIIYNVNTDYYEDVLGATEYKEQLFKNKREGKSVRFNTKLRKIKQSYKGNGAKAIFYRQILEYRKSGFFFINMRTLSMIIAGIFFGMSIGGNNIIAVLYFSAYMLLIFSFQGKWSDEIQKPYIFLIPSSSFSKVFYATLADNIKNFIDGVVLFIIVGIKFKTSPLIIFLCSLAYASFGAIYIYIDILARRMFKIESKTLETFFKFIFAIFIVAPGISISVYLAIAYRDVRYMKYLMYLILIGYNLFISAIILIFNKAIFENLEMH